MGNDLTTAIGGGEGGQGYGASANAAGGPRAKKPGGVDGFLYPWSEIAAHVYEKGVRGKRIKAGSGSTTAGPADAGTVDLLSGSPDRPAAVADSRQPAAAETAPKPPHITREITERVLLRSAQAIHDLTDPKQSYAEMVDNLGLESQSFQPPVEWCVALLEDKVLPNEEFPGSLEDADSSSETQRRELDSYFRPNGYGQNSGVYAELQEARFNLVPRFIEEESFWSRYVFQIMIIVMGSFEEEGWVVDGDAID